jgi:hypothetical protein
VIVIVLCIVFLQATAVSNFLQKLWQLGDIRRDPSRSDRMYFGRGLELCSATVAKKPAAMVAHCGGRIWCRDDVSREKKRLAHT